MKLAVIGDLHGCFSDADVRWFDAAGYDRLLFVGDLAGYRHATTLAIVRRIAALKTPSIIIPGNHDAVHGVQMLAEVVGRPGIGRLFTAGQGRKLDALSAALPGRHALAGYSHHPLADNLALVAARPQSIGGQRLAFVPHLKRRFGVQTMADSSAALCRLIDAAPEPDLVFLAHNGPAGLGAAKNAIWGCDFRAEAGDWGDPDLAAAVAHAVACGKRVLAVIAGHMHRRMKGGGQRATLLHREGITYLNAAEVPRIREGKHHHVAVTIADGGVQVEERWVEV